MILGSTMVVTPICLVAIHSAATLGTFAGAIQLRV
jgi:hypothetical protein